MVGIPALQAADHVGFLRGFDVGTHIIDVELPGDRLSRGREIMDRGASRSIKVDLWTCYSRRLSLLAALCGWDTGLIELI